MAKIFIDGSSGTTGLRLRERLLTRSDIDLLTIPEELRKDPEARAEMFRKADISFLCLPDAASREAISLVGAGEAVFIDTSTAHRTAQGWVYGFPELHGRREALQGARRVANPGCHASGFISLTAPLVESGLISPDEELSCFSLTGYSGGGKKMIAEYEEEPTALLSAPRMYSLGQQHKHLPEMMKYTGLKNAPIFCPIVAPYYAGMEVTVPLFADHVKGTPEDIRSCYRDYYHTGLVQYEDSDDEGGFLSACSREGRDTMSVRVDGNSERILLVSRFDNLGKGASGAAIQNMNLLLGIPEETGLVL